MFVDPPEQDAPRAGDPNVRYFGPGVHRPGRIELESNQTVYVAGGAVVYGSIHARRASNVRILGRGIVDVSESERGQGGGAIRLEDCTDITIDGLVLRDPDVWCCSLFGCRNAEIRNIKLVGLWRYNADGIDLCNSQDIRVRDCFVRAFDDCIVLKGLRRPEGNPAVVSYHERPVRDIIIERCVLWNDWGRAMEIGAETSAPEIADVVFHDCDIIRTVHIAMDIQHGDRAVVRDIRFENIRVEGDDFNLRPRLQKARDETYTVDPQDDYRPYLLYIVIGSNFYSRDRQSGVVRNIIFKDIEVTSKLFPPSSFRGADAEHNVIGVTIDNLRVNGRRCTSPEEARLEIHPHVSDVTFVS
ncbi:MAG: glycosyl hydrolase family 28 protein [bacterium]|nr:glycosyl hydrolase family 28 protein [bacterium]